MAVDELLTTSVYVRTYDPRKSITVRGVRHPKLHPTK